MSKHFSFDEIAQVLRNENGTLIWRVKSGNAKPGDVAGCLHWEGYLVFGYRGRQLSAHRVVWLLTHGEWPSMIDHINGIKTDNRPSNLRLCTAAQNAANKPPTRTGFKGVALHKQTKKFQASCARRYIGLYATEEEAARAYDAAAKRHYGPFAFLNFPEAA